MPRRYYCEQQQQQSETEKKKAAEEEAARKQREEYENMFFLKREYYGLKTDVHQFPDIYNYINVFQFILFTVFCLSSTGSTAETEFWVKYCGVDGSGKCFLAPFLHAFLTTNFLAMSFAMLLVHNVGHTLITAVGAKFLVQYLGAVTILSGFGMMALNALVPSLTTESQYGPWDLIAGLFYASAVSSGFTPFQLLNSFNGWVKYASWLGAGVILYYDWQPCLFGVVIAVALHRFGLMKIPAAAAAA
jgi:hypothetical protein